jgi:hypothetical protein
MTIDPRWSIFLSVGLAILAFLAGAGGQFTDLGLDPKTVKAILALFTIFLGIGNSVNAVLGAIPSKDKTTGFYLGPKVDPPVGAPKP